MRVACPACDVKAIISLGTPFSAEGRLYSYEYLAACNKPKLFLSGGADQYANRSQLEQLAATTPNATLVIVDEADHFFAGKLDQMRTAIETWIVAQGVAPAASAD
jgi:alpha/beta superfamily hydrolase